jgi:hypothetical protein
MAHKRKFKGVSLSEYAVLLSGHSGRAKGF